MAGRPKKANSDGKAKLTTTLPSEVKNEMAEYCFHHDLYMGDLIVQMFCELKKKEERANKRKKA